MTGTETSRMNRILIIDDNSAIHRDFRKILCKESEDETIQDLEKMLFGEEETSSFQEPITYEIESAYQGQEGLKKVIAAVKEGRPYGLAFVDMRMPPGWDGLKTIKEIWKHDPRLQIVICTAFSDYSWQQIVEQLGTSDNLLILKKPFDIAEVSQLAAALTRKRWLEEETRRKMYKLESLVAERTRSLEQALAEQRRSQNFLQSALDSLPAAICILDQSGRIKAVNAVWRQGPDTCRFFGAKIVPGADYLAVCKEHCNNGDETGKLMVEAIVAVLRGERDTAWLEYACNHGPGGPRCYALKVSKFDTGDERHAIVVHEDITEIKQLQMHLQQAQKLEAVGQLAAGVAHEINTPLQYVGDNIDYLIRCFGQIETALRNFQEVISSLKNGGIDNSRLEEIEKTSNQLGLTDLLEDIPETLKDCRDGISSIAAIVRAMKEFSHPGTGEKAPVDVNKTIESTVTVARNEWKYVADVELDLDPDLPLVPGYEGDLKQVFLNLLVNAAQAIGEVVGDGSQGKGKIIIRTRQEDDWVVVEFIDNGPGIPERLQSRIFEPFFTTKPVGKGTGQGLAIAHSVIVKKHEGRIEVESEAGSGTTFRVWLPLKPRDESEDKDEEQDQKEQPAGQDGSAAQPSEAAVAV